MRPSPFAYHDICVIFVIVNGINYLNMKRLLIILSAMALLSSCFDKGAGRTYALVADFQYSDISFRSDSTFINTNDAVGFGYDLLNFYHQLDVERIWFDGGFILSCQQIPASGVTDGLFNTYRALVPKDWGVGNIYTVFYQNPDPALMPAHDIEFAFTEDGTCTMGGCYVTNTVEVADFVRENFVSGDKMIVKATGYMNGEKTGEAELALADFSAQKDSIVSTWTLFDLMKLGSVEYVDFEIISSKPDVPGYFCMDHLVTNIVLEY